MDQALSLIGAVLILTAYAGHQAGRLDARRVAYNLLNLAGAALLTLVALSLRNWGFVLLEGAWTLLSVRPLLRALGR